MTIQDVKRLIKVYGPNAKVVLVEQNLKLIYEMGMKLKNDSK